MKAHATAKQRRPATASARRGSKVARPRLIKLMQNKKAAEVAAASVATAPSKKVKVRAQSLADQAYNIIRQRIVTLQLAPGEWFKERQLAEEIGFGAMPLREAIDRLEQEGLVKTVPRRGHQVAPMTAKYVRDFFDVWGPLAATVGRLASARATEEQAREITRAIDQCVATVANASQVPTEYLINQSAEVFQKVVDIADNEHFSEIWRRLSGIKQRIFMKAFKQDPAVSHVVSTIADLANAWRSRDPDMAVQATERYVMNARAQVLRLL